MFEESEKKLYERAAFIEGMEGTVKREYATQPDDVKNSGATSSIKIFLVISSIFAIGSLALFLYGIIEKKGFVTGAALGFFIFMFIIALFFVLSIINIKKNFKNVHSEDVVLSFNAYGVVMRIASEVRLAVYAYEWKEFESITENEKTLVAIKQGLSYIFPKRVMTEEEYNKFRRFSYASLGNKCLYKNFKQN